MLDLLIATATLLLGVALGAAVLAGLTVAPFVAAGDLAARRGGSVDRAGAAALVTALVGLATAFLLYRSDLPTVLVLLPLAACWLVPGLLWLSGPSRLLGRPGAHQQ